MIWVGIGLIIIGLALLVLVGVLIKPLIKVSGVLSDMKKTTKDLPETVNELTTQVSEAMDTGVDTLQQINLQLKELTPIFYLVGDVGRATQQLSTNMVHAVEDFKKKETADFASRRNLEGLYGALTLGIMVFKSAKDFNNKRKVVNEQ